MAKLVTRKASTRLRSTAESIYTTSMATCRLTAKYIAVKVLVTIVTLADVGRNAVGVDTRLVADRLTRR